MKYRQSCEDTVSALYNSYQDWCNCCGMRPISIKAMSQKLEERGFQRHHCPGSSRYYSPVRRRQKSEMTDMTDMGCIQKPFHIHHRGEFLKKASIRHIRYCGHTRAICSTGSAIGPQYGVV